MKYLIAVFTIVLLSTNVSAEESGNYKITTFPKIIGPCEKGSSTVYAECADQSEILNLAIIEAKKIEKTVLVVYGAEWCIWCHVFDKYINGYHSNFDYRWTYQGGKKRWTMTEKENLTRAFLAQELNKYVSENFVVAHIEGQFANGKYALSQVGVDTDRLMFMPYIISLNENGKYLTHMPAGSGVEGLEKREDSGAEYRGYDRLVLLNELKKLKKK